MERKSHAREAYPKEKGDQLGFLKTAFQNVQVAILTSVQGLTVAEVSDLRRRLHDAGVNYKVVKNTLAKKAVAGTPLEAVAQDFKTATAVAWSDKDPVAPAKVIVNFKKDVEKFIIKSAFQGGQRLDPAGIEALSKMPSIEELRAQLLGVIQGVPAKLMAQINAPAQHVVGVLQAKHDEDKKKAA